MLYTQKFLFTIWITDQRPQNLQIEAMNEKEKFTAAGGTFVLIHSSTALSGLMCLSDVILG